jgi:hypothetical protein
MVRGSNPGRGNGHSSKHQTSYGYQMQLPQGRGRKTDVDHSMCLAVRLGILLLFSTCALQPARLIVRSGLHVPTFATRCLHARAPSGGRWNCGQEMSGNFAWMPKSTLHLGIFSMPQSYDMGPTALLPLRRKACWGFLRPKNPTVSARCELGYKRPARYL